jgi:peroxiredoxin (alkyl hydroperoxide reductase subunit C)
MFSRLLARAPSALARAYHVSALPAVRRAAPAFSAPAVVNGAFKHVALKDYAGKYLTLFWYPLDFTFVCPTEITAFSDRAKEFQAIGAEVVGISIDSTFSHLAWINTPRNKGGLGPMAIPLIGDISKEVSRAYGMVVEDASDDMHGVTLRGTVIISPAGKVLHVSNTDAPVGRSVDEVLRLIQAFQYVEKHGEVCPAGWKPGQKTVRGVTVQEGGGPRKGRDCQRRHAHAEVHRAAVVAEHHPAAARAIRRIALGARARARSRSRRSAQAAARADTP